MKRFIITTAIVAAIASPALAQDKAGTPRAYVSAFGGAVDAGGNNTSSLLFEGGVRVAPHLLAFGNIGRFSNLTADLQPALDATTTTLSNQGVGVTATGTLPAWYGVGGLRAEASIGRHAIPYALAGIGAARLMPTPHLAFTTGVLPDGTTPVEGTDITSELVSTGVVTTPQSSTATLMMVGAGVQVPVAQRWAADVGYRLNHLAADSTLSAASLNANVVTFGVGYRF